MSSPTFERKSANFFLSLRPSCVLCRWGSPTSPETHRRAVQDERLKEARKSETRRRKSEARQRYSINQTLVYINQSLNYINQTLNYINQGLVYRLLPFGVSFSVEKISFPVESASFSMSGEKLRLFRVLAATKKPEAKLLSTCFRLLSAVSGRQDSNLRPPGPKPGALPTALRPVRSFRNRWQNYAFLSR